MSTYVVLGHTSAEIGISLQYGNMWVLGEKRMKGRKTLQSTSISDTTKRLHLISTTLYNTP